MKGTYAILAIIILMIATSSCSKYVSNKSSDVRIPVLYIDMDGTLLDPDHKIRPASLKAIERFKSCGGKIGIATGRSLYQASEYLPQVRPNLPVVLYNGAVTVTPDGKSFLRTATLDDKTYRAVLDAVKRLGPEVSGYLVETKSERIIDKENEKIVPIVKKYFGNYRVDPTMTPKPGEKPIKVLLFVKQDQIDPIAKKLSETLKDQASVVGTHATVEIVPKGVNKAVAIEEALKGRGFELSKDVFIIGDSGNDVAMLTEAAYGFAMKNCRPAACAVADAIIGPNDSNAIADLIEHVAISSSCKM